VDEVLRYDTNITLLTLDVYLTVQIGPPIHRYQYSEEADPSHQPE